MNKFPLTSLAFYRVKKDFISDPSKDRFMKDSILQFQSSNTNVHDGIEILEFIEWGTGKKKVWHFVDMNEQETLKGWDSFIELVDRKSVVGN